MDRFAGGIRKGSDILVQALEREGVDTVFAYPGGASMEIHQALTRSTTVRNILCRHEQGEIFAAEGYAKSTGRVGVCIATSGPGATNLVTGLADAMLDSVPLVAITGQVPRRLIGTDAFQETPIVEARLPRVRLRLFAFAWQEGERGCSTAARPACRPLLLLLLLAALSLYLLSPHTPRTPSPFPPLLIPCTLLIPYSTPKSKSQTPNNPNRSPARSRSTTSW